MIELDHMLHCFGTTFEYLQGSIIVLDIGCLQGSIIIVLDIGCLQGSIIIVLDIGCLQGSIIVLDIGCLQGSIIIVLDIGLPFQISFGKCKTKMVCI